MNETRIVGRRLKALREAIVERNWEGVVFHFDNVVRGVGHLAAALQATGLDEEGWQPLERATSVVPLSEAAEATLRARGADDALIDELATVESWKNNIYTVIVTRFDNGQVQELSIRRNDRMPVHDWRHFQMIKTQLAGPEIEAIELYPAESRLMDTANQYYVYCLPAGEQLPMGYAGPRLLVDADEHGDLPSVQRPLPEGWVSTFAEVYKS